jgi:hypothetical protein
MSLSASLSGKVFVYFNLHRKCLSVKALEGAHKGRVIAYADTIVLHGATFKVSEAGRQRVIREKRKNVHAGVTGYIVGLNPCGYFIDAIKNIGSPVKYNPYKYTSFVHAVNETPVHEARHVAIVASNGRASMFAELS